ncbi:hypothetical protein B0H17DRAFT_1102776 [Mycena rosella]|uniref:Uncharacterized protein n=1 Tax=Mycena rosella TaxID=1033263 RepID=A0AAD7CHD1_MYCRO|nr:hypothetical protein B0H17DRAFT_1102776 [Mycena rosella]
MCDRQQATTHRPSHNSTEIDSWREHHPGDSRAFGVDNIGLWGTGGDLRYK